MGPFNGSYVCMDCDVDTHALGEWYMVSDDLWLRANPDINGVLCIGCLESRLGHKVSRDDFNLSLLALFARNGVKFSERLLERVAE